MDDDDRADFYLSLLDGNFGRARRMMKRDENIIFKYFSMPMNCPGVRGYPLWKHFVNFLREDDDENYAKKKGTKEFARFLAGRLNGIYPDRSSGNGGDSNSNSNSNRYNGTEEYYSFLCRFALAANWVDVAKECISGGLRFEEKAIFLEKGRVTTKEIREVFDRWTDDSGIAFVPDTPGIPVLEDTFGKECGPLILNMTPHDISVYRNNNGESCELTLVGFYPKSTRTCRCVPSPVVECDPIQDGTVPVILAPSFSSVEGLPGVKEKGVLLPDDGFSPDILVSMPVGEILRNEPERYRGAVYGPDTGPDGVIRDDKGAIKGTFRLVLYKPRSS